MLLIGLDVGTTNIKGILFTPQGQMVASASRPTRTHYLGTEIADFSPEEFWEDIQAILRELVSRCPSPERIVALSFASFGEAGVALDKRGNPLAPAIAWFDQRSWEVMEAWRSQVDEYEIFRITGMRINHVSSLAKILWERQHRPDVYRQTKKWLFMASYLIHKLTGEYCADYSIASRSMLFDIHAKVWSERMCQLAGIPVDLLPPTFPSGTPVGEIRRDVAGDLGLKGKVTVVLGGHDHPCGALSVGLRKKGEVVNSTGTGDVLCALIDPARIDRGFFEAGVSCGCHVAGSHTYMLAGTYAAGKLVDWFLENFSAESELPREQLYERIATRAASAPAGSHGVVVFPHLRGCRTPHNDPLSKGAILGLRTTHTWSDIARAIFEGLSMEVRILLETFTELTGATYPEIRCFGGGSRNRFWVQMKADVLSRRMRINAIQENAALGAALLAGIGSGVYRDADEAFQNLSLDEETFVPDPASTQVYRQMYETFYRDLYPRLAPINHDIEAMLKVLP